MWRSLRRLERDLERWQDAGWVTQEGAGAIRADLAGRSGRFGLAGVLGTLGAVLIAFAAMSFVAANWEGMSKLARLIMLVAGIGGAYGTAGLLMARGHRALADAAVLIGVGVFGASIMLIAQMYHIDGNPPDAVLTWGAGALAAGALLGSRPSLGLAMLLVALWAGWETTLMQGVFWLFLPAWAAVTAAIAADRWGHGLKLAGLVLGVFVVSLGYLLNQGHAHELVLGLGLAAAALGYVAERSGHPLAVDAAPDAGRLGLGVAFAGLYAMQFFDHHSLGMLALLAVFAIVLTLAAVWWGWRSGHRDVLWLGYSAFSLEILTLYFRTIGTLLGSSVFFLTVGLVVIALSVVATRLGRASAGATPLPGRTS